MGRRRERDDLRPWSEETDTPWSRGSGRRNGTRDEQTEFQQHVYYLLQRELQNSLKSSDQMTRQTSEHPHHPPPTTTRP